MMVSHPNPTKDKLLKLIAEKDKLESKIKNYGAVLEANKNVGMHNPLIDAEGFPRNDIDMYQVREARQQIISLQNDHKQLMQQIEKLMHQLHSEVASGEREQCLSSRTADMQLSSTSANAEKMSDGDDRALKPIVKVNLVCSGSPADEAGLTVGDKILEFGTINSNNFENINQIGELVRHKQNQIFAVKVLRGTQLLDLVFIPRTWSGRGLLGCNVVLPDADEFQKF